VGISLCRTRPTGAARAVTRLGRLSTRRIAGAADADCRRPASTRRARTRAGSDLGRPAASRVAPSACGTASARRYSGIAGSVMGITRRRACGGLRPRGTSVESARGTVMGCGAAGGTAFGPASYGLGRAGSCARAGNSTGAGLE
jgi:hypothetical protein